MKPYNPFIAESELGAATPIGRHPAVTSRIVVRATDPTGRRTASTGEPPTEVLHMHPYALQ